MEEHCLRVGSSRFSEAMGNSIYLIRNLTNFSYLDEQNNEKGDSIKEKSRIILALLEDSEKLDEERTNYKKWKDRIAGVSNSGGLNSVSSSSYGNTRVNAISSSNYNQSYSNYKKGPSKKSQPEFESSSDEEDTKKKKKKKEPEEEEFDEVKEGNENPFDFQPKENPIKKNPPQISIKKPQSKQVQKSHHDEEFEEVQEENNDIFALGGSRPTDTNKQGVKNNNMFDFGGVDFSGGSTKKKDDFIDFSGKSAPSGNDNNVFDLSGNNQVQSSHITGTQQKAPISTEDLLKNMYGNPSNSGPSNIGNNMYGSNPDYGFNQMYNNQMSQNMYNNQMSQNMYNNHMNQNMYNYQMSQNPPNMNMYNFNNYNNMNMYNVNNYSYSNQNQQQEKIVLNKGTLKSSQAVSEDDFTEVVEDPQNKKGLNNLLDPKLVNLNNLNTKSKQHGKTKKEFNFY